MRHTKVRPAPPLDYAPPDERWSAGGVGEMLAGLAALAFVGFGVGCMFYTIAWVAVAVSR